MKAIDTDNSQVAQLAQDGQFLLWVLLSPVSIKYKIQFLPHGFWGKVILLPLYRMLKGGLESPNILERGLESP